MSVTIDKDGWIAEAIGIYYPNRSWGAFTQKPREIVLHGTATPHGTAQNIATYWANNAGDASAHILINKDGSYVQGLSLNATSWANCCLTDNPNTGAKWDRRLPLGNQNEWSISIEHCKDDPNQNSDILTPAQQATSFALCKAICEYHGIPKQVIGFGDITNGGIVGHCNIDALNRTYCPGPYPWKDLQMFLQGAPMTALQKYQSNPHIKQELDDCWKSVNPNAPTGTGIWLSWLSLWLDHGIQAGPVLTIEYNSVDGNGNPIKAQEFAHLRCEWDSQGVPRWYGAQGKVVI